MKENFYGEI